MLKAITFLLLRIFSNPIANTFQKKLACKYSSLLINFYTYLFMSILCIVPASKINWSNFSFEFWSYVFIAGALCTLGTVCLIKALKNGELSILGPINSYKCVIGLISSFVLLKEIPTIYGFLGLIFIIAGSRINFDTTEEGFSIALFKRQDIQLRFVALILTGIEAAFLKKIIIMSSVQISFILWAFAGFIFSALFILLAKDKFKIVEKKDFKWIFVITICLTIMQYSTNIVFKYLDVGLSLALFQLSSLIAIFLGYKYFNEKDMFKKTIGTIIMLIGAALIFIT
ncbi:MAG: DMT family transporter [bacterium]|nr:DMT family transporter [bacterium]